MQSSKLLLDEYPLIILPGLAVAIGLNEAIVLQQIHYWLQHFQRVENECERDKDKRHFRDGHWWVYNSVDEWSDQFPFWGYDTVRRALKSLREPSSPQGDDGHAPRGPLLVATSEYNQVKFDKTLWYTIDYDELDRLCKQLEQQASTGGTDETDNRLGQDAPTVMAKPTHRLWQNATTSSAKSTDRSGQNPLTSGAKTHNRSALIAPVDPANLHQPIPETTIDYAETSPETTAGAETVAVNRNGLLKRLASSAPAAALLEEFGIDTSVVSPDEVDPITARAWMLYTLVQPDLDNPQAYVAKRLLQRTAPPSQFVDWARLTTQEWQTLWRADRYDGPYLEMLPHRLKKLLPAWAEDFGGNTA
jgi:hypothetical protein